jgi:hypothetical protein
MSLGRFQVTVWTLIVIPALFTIAVYNIGIQYSQQAPITDALSISVPIEIWALIGVSVTSLAGKMIIDNSQDGVRAPANLKDEVKNYLNMKYNIPKTDTDIESIIVKYKNFNHARFANLFTGNQVGNCTTIDLGKVQMFFFTVLLAITYSVALFTLFLISPAGKMISAMPAFSQGMLILLTISHAGYLTIKAQNITPRFAT